MIKNLLKEEASDSIITRVKNLSAAHQPQWGGMTASEMLLHCNSCNRQILEESRGNKKTTIKQYLLRVLALYIAPNFKKNIKGELRHIAKGKANISDFEEQRNEFILLIGEFPANDHPLTLSHPAFGNISTNEWGIAAYKHMDHHLRQFGV
ncbi:DUF1569 domain-containing protein [Elizabethkingia anophelis]|uniref:Protein of uncharacterized function (DUF1569) n=1 Tax=Elizabethkingia anophelis TaxID=1117645 RepID=A0A7Z7LXA4_9FLAO|nr:DUF1569 domain-containing protein [Elizabethkingia anophelis]MCT3629143.1 DUF1569 domain-containing protein [Elizabethkingia anophelis]MCT3633010.1 DUF1569 domain-containing protein [Elizabethkingia anophelis]MCT3719747.1 DUF1569 domain-containing protein [Elizabethkingia anophelis]MCT3723257.1 DUF1569 domain-containing protein [Elizabethkingia anophelis]MCT3755131.1 DUF1569 domain-containing protein [Elizabethkingia anophelis]